MNDKEYGKLSEDQFKDLIRGLTDLRRESAAMQSRLRQASKERIRQLFGDHLWWSFYYELTLGESLGYLLFMLGKVDWIKRVADLPDPQQAVLDEIRRTDDDDEWEPAEGFSQGDLFGATVALQRNILSIFFYRQSLCALVHEARETGNDDCLFKAIRVDRSVMCGPTGALRLSRAEAMGDKDFFLRLRSAVKGPSKRHMLGMDVKYSLFVLRELGFDKMTDDQLEHLLVRVLKVYPNHPNARKNLRKQFAESRRLKAL
jgi:hypothetical protein